MAEVAGTGSAGAGGADQGEQMPNAKVTTAVQFAVRLVAVQCEALGLMRGPDAVLEVARAAEAFFQMVAEKQSLVLRFVAIVSKLPLEKAAILVSCGDEMLSPLAVARTETVESPALAETPLADGRVQGAA
jgi:hypothetical protein